MVPKHFSFEILVKCIEYQKQRIGNNVKLVECFLTFLILNISTYSRGLSHGRIIAYM